MKKIKLLKTFLISTIGITAIGTIAAVSTSCSCSCSPVVIVTGVSLNKESLSLGIGDSDTLTATVLPENATDKSVTWSSSNSNVATVDNNGKVTAVDDGSAKITVKTNDGGFTATCQVSVNQGIIHVIGVWFSENSLELYLGDSETLIHTVYPYDASDRSVTWSSSNSSVVSVDNNGEVTAVREGQATITVKTNDGGFTDTCQVTAHQKTPVTGVSLDKKSLALVTGDFDTLNATVEPEDATDKSVTWSSSNSSVATVNNNGKVTAVSAGSAKITVKTIDCGYEDYCDVTVVEPSAVYMCVTAHADSTLELRNEGENNPNLQYSDDLKIWHDYSGTISIPTGSMYYLKGNNPTGWSQSSAKFSHFYIAGNVSLSGNAMGLLDNGTVTTSSIPNDYCFYGLFSNSPGITSVNGSFLPATTLTTSCYDRMFISCSSLRTAALTLPATTLAESCYYGMFDECSSLTTVPDLPATELANHCYHNMFMQCDALTTAPNLPATTLAEYSYAYMFANCNALTTVPDLPATNLDTFCCQGMFEACTSIAIMPALPATTLAGGCYSFMFHNCRSLWKVPDLPATTLAEYCYYDMFSGCWSLVSVRLGYNKTTDEAPRHAFLGENGGYHWNNAIAEEGTLYYTGTVTNPVNHFWFPSGWTHKPY